MRPREPSLQKCSLRLPPRTRVGLPSFAKQKRGDQLVLKVFEGGVLPAPAASGAVPGGVGPQRRKDPAWRGPPPPPPGTAEDPNNIRRAWGKRGSVALGSVTLGPVGPSTESFPQDNRAGICFTGTGGYRKPDSVIPVHTGTAAIHLGPALPPASCSLPVPPSPARGRRSKDGPPLKRNLFGLAPGGGCRALPVARQAGGLLPHRFTLTAGRDGRRRSAFCCPVPGVAPGRR